MKVVAVLGSPHEHGPSSTLAKEILRGAADAGHDTVVYNINDMNIKGCQACGYCKDNGADCIIEDDLKPYWKDLHECGALILASPNYCGNVTGPMITFMNRHYCIMMRDGTVTVDPGIKLVGVFSQGNGNKEAYISRYKEYLHDFEARKMELVDIIVHTKREDYTQGSDLCKKAYSIGNAL